MTTPTIAIVGCGMRGSVHLTVEAIQEIGTAASVFHMVTGEPAVDALHRLNPNVHSLIGFYREGDLDLDVYGRIVSFLIAAALHQRRVAFVVMGHPSIYVAPTHLLREHAPRWGIDVRICPGISAIDTILAAMPFDIGSTGLQILDANRIVSYGLEPAANVPLLVLQVGCFGSGYITRTTTNRPDRLVRLAAHLQKYYPADHIVEIIESEMDWPHQAVRTAMPLDALARNGHLVTYNTTLYVPAFESVRVVDPQFQQELLNPDAVTRLVEAEV